MELDLLRGPADLTLDLVNIPSVSGDERALADLLEAALRHWPHLQVDRDGDAIVARTAGPAHGHGRVVIAGHLDTVPIASNVPGRLVRDDSGRPTVWGRGSVDMKAGVAVMAHLAANLINPTAGVTWVFYDHEEVSADQSGLGRILNHHPDWLAGDFAVLCEPTAASLEGGCNGTARVAVTVQGKAAHSARPWLGVNAIHAATPVLQRLATYQPAKVEVDGLVYREALNAVAIDGGIAGNVIPDRCQITINYRFAPNKTPGQALDHLTELLAGFSLTVDDLAGGARPGLDHPAAQGLVRLATDISGPPRAKEGWTDVARFAELGMPAVNLGPGDPGLAHADNEHCPVDQITQVTRIIRSWLMALPG